MGEEFHPGFDRAPKKGKWNRKRTVYDPMGGGRKKVARVPPLPEYEEDLVTKLMKKPENDRPCTVCYREGTETLVAFCGAREFIVSGYVQLGLPPKEAARMFEYNIGSDALIPALTVGAFGVGSLRSGEREGWVAGVLVCRECAGKAEIDVGVMGEVPCYIQAGFDAPHNPGAGWERKL